jgi:hypothetical protein
MSIIILRVLFASFWYIIRLTLTMKCILEEQILFCLTCTVLNSNNTVHLQIHEAVGASLPAGWTSAASTGGALGGDDGLDIQQPQRR